MRIDIETTEKRKRVGGGHVLDVIFSDGTKRKYDPEKMAREKKRLTSLQVTTQQSLDTVTADLTFVEDELNK